MAQTEVRSTGQTGTICQTSAPYSPVRHPYITMFVKKGAKFTVDPVDGQSTSWSVTKANASLGTAETQI